MPAILNSGSGAWAFEEFSNDLSSTLWCDVVSKPAAFNYLLAWDVDTAPEGELFIPWEAMRIAADKRLQADVFNRSGVPTPATKLCENVREALQFVEFNRNLEWALKYPTGCGGCGHRLVNSSSPIPSDWPTPFVVQEFIRMESPEVYRIYCVDQQLFGWNARRYPKGAATSPWVAHARGARYVHLGDPPTGALRVAEAALRATGLYESFGIVDLLPRGDEWLALEVGTDGIANHVDRQTDNPSLESELNRRLAEAFWERESLPPWRPGKWHPREESGPGLD